MVGVKEAPVRLPIETARKSATIRHVCLADGDPPSKSDMIQQPFLPSIARNLNCNSDTYYSGSQLCASAGALHCEGFVTRNALTESAPGTIFVLVGLPGRGKSFISRKIEGFLKWQGKKTKMFNAGAYRRSCEDPSASGRAAFFDSNNKAALAIRTEAASNALVDLLQYLDEGNEIGIFDATNSTEARRQMIIREAEKRRRNYHVIFIEILCTDPVVLETNFRNKVLHSPDFKGLSLEDAIRDLQERVKQYETRYETVEDDSTSYIKMYNMSSKVLVNRIYGWASKSLLPYLMSVHIGSRPIWLVRAAQVATGRHQDAELTEEGELFAQKLSSFVRRRLREFHGDPVPAKPLKVLSSTVNSCVHTVEALLHSSTDWCSQTFKQTSSLNPLDRGRLGGSWWIDLCTDKPPFRRLAEKDPNFYSKFEANKFHTRFPGGESYFDVQGRAESALLDIEMSTKPILVVSHVTVLQLILSYFRGTPVEESWDVPVPLHRVCEITPTLGGGYEMQVIDIDSDHVDA